MRPQYSKPATLVLFLSIVALSACIKFGGTEQQTMFYALESLPPAPQSTRLAAGPGDDLSLGIGPVKWPKYLDRPQIVTRIGPNQYHMAEFAQWTENLSDNFTHVLAENLSTLLATDRVSIFPWGRSKSIDLQVIVEVIRFEHDEGEGTVFQSRWTVLGGDEKQVLVMKRSEFKTPEDSGDYQAIVANMSKVLGELCKEIAGTIQAL